MDHFRGEDSHQLANESYFLGDPFSQIDLRLCPPNEFHTTFFLIGSLLIIMLPL